MAKSTATKNKPLSKSEVLNAVADALGEEISRKQVKEVVETLATVGHKELKKNGVFVLHGFAKFVVVKKPARPAREGINPFTKEKQMFAAKPASKAVRAPRGQGDQRRRQVKGERRVPSPTGFLPGTCLFSRPRWRTARAGRCSSVRVGERAARERLADRVVGGDDRAIAPAALVVLRAIERRARLTEVIERRLHVPLVAALAREGDLRADGDGERADGGEGDGLPDVHSFVLPWFGCVSRRVLLMSADRAS